MTGPRRASGTGPAVAALVAAMASTAVGTSLATGLFATVGAAGTTAYRVGFGALILAAVWRPWQWRVGRRDAATLAAYGVSMGVMNLLFYQSLRTVPLGPAAALEFVGPMAVSAASSRRGVDLLWVAMAATGLLLLLAPGGHGRLDPAGAAFALSAGGCWAAYIVFGQRAGTATGPRATAVGMAVAAAVVVPVGVGGAGAALLAPRAIGVGVVVAALSSAVPYSLEMVALRRLPRRTFGVLLSLAPAISAIGGFVVQGERLTAVQCAAVAVVVAASAGAAATARSAAEGRGRTHVASPKAGGTVSDRNGRA